MYEPEYYDKRFKWREEQRLNLVSKLNIKPGKLLDIGCATGQFMRGMNHNGWEVTGIDMNKKYIDYAKSLGLNANVQKLESIRTVDKYGLITMMQVFEHLKNPAEVLKIVKRLMDTTGYMVIEVPNANALTNIYYRLFKPNKLIEYQFVVGHQHLFTKRDISKLIQESGFRITQLRTVTYKDTESFKINIRVKIGYWVRRSITWLNFGELIWVVATKR